METTIKLKTLWQQAHSNIVPPFPLFEISSPYLEESNVRTLME